MELALLIISATVLLFSLIWLIVSRKRHKGLSSIFAIIILVISFGSTIRSGVTVGKILHISDDEISIIRTEEGILSQTFELSAKKDIDDLEITFTFYNSENKVVGTIIKPFPLIEEKKTYLFSISASDFSFEDLLTVKNYDWKITGGKGTL